LEAVFTDKLHAWKTYRLRSRWGKDIVLRISRVPLQYWRFSSFHPGRIAIRDSPDNLRILSKTWKQTAQTAGHLHASSSRSPWKVGTIVFVLSYAVEALLGLSLVGSVSAEIREPSARATQFHVRPQHREQSPRTRVVQCGRQAKCFSHLHSDRFVPVDDQGGTMRMEAVVQIWCDEYEKLLRIVRLP
jgi:hypothetical protein